MHAHLLITSAKKIHPRRETPPPLPTSSQHHLCCQFEISRRSTCAQGVGPRFPYPRTPVLVVAREQAAGHCHVRLDSLTVSGADTGESTKDPQRPVRLVIWSLEVHLDDFPAGPPARVSDADYQRKVLTSRDRLGTRRERFVGPVRIAQAVAEAEERLSLLPVVASVAHEQALGVGEIAGPGLGVQHRRVRLVTRHRYRKAAPRFRDTGDHVRERLGKRLAREPDLE